MVAGARPNRANCGTSLSELGRLHSFREIGHSQARGLRVAERVQDDAVGFDGRHGSGIVGLGRGARQGPRGNPASRAPGRLPLGCQRRRCVQKSSGDRAGRRREVRSLGVVNDASAAPNSRTRTDASTLPAAAPSRLVLEFRRPDTASRHGDDARRVSFLRSRSRASRFDAHPGRDGSPGASQRARAWSRNSRGGGEEARGGATGGETSARAARGALRVGTMRRRAARLWRGRLVADVLGSRGGVSDAEVGVILGRKRRDARRRRCEALRRRDERGGGVHFWRRLR